MSSNYESSSRGFVDSSQSTNRILDSGATCHMTPQYSDFILGLLEDTDKYSEFADEQYFMAKQKRKVQIKMCDDNGDTLIETLHNVILAPDL